MLPARLSLQAGPATRHQRRTPAHSADFPALALDRGDAATIKSRVFRLWRDRADFRNESL